MVYITFMPTLCKKKSKNIHVGLAVCSIWMIHKGQDWCPALSRLQYIERESLHYTQ